MSEFKKLLFTIKGQKLVAKVGLKDLGFKPTHVWNPSPSYEHRVTPYELPMDIIIGLKGNRITCAKYSPPPFALILENKDQKALISVACKPGYHFWNQVDFFNKLTGSVVEIDLEGHSDPKVVNKKVELHITLGNPGESRHELLKRGLMQDYPEANKPRKIPDWWLKPIYCGWGDQVTISQYLEGVGEEARALAYCTQGLYERWIRRLDEAGVPFGTTIIDAGWSPTGVWEVDTIKWPDLRGFIDREHARGRKVLLWIGTWLYDGLAKEYCSTMDGQQLTTDPTNPKYMKKVTEWVKHLIGPDGINADGFKIDQLAWSPSHRRFWTGSRFGLMRELEPSKKRVIKFHGKGWGTELLYRLQKNIYESAKSVKPDCLITSSTVHPYFHDTFDMVRIHDMGYVAEDIFEAMKARVDLGKAALPHAPTDTDDWVHTNYDTWLKYTAGSHVLGVPCIFYAEHFMLNWKAEPATKLIPMSDLKKIAKEWKKHAL
jgi:hypothetical protein